MSPSHVSWCYIELADIAETLLRERLLRTNPEWSSTEVEAAVDDWYHHRPGAEFGDSEGRAVSWPRQSHQRR
jgi:hypothetical protein